MSETRQTFLKAVGSAAALPFTLPVSKITVGDRNHAFVAASQSDTTEERMWHGYPDECYSFTTFCDSLVALAWGQGWYMQPPMVDVRNAMIVDFASRTESEAEASIGAWNGAWEFPMGTVSTVKDRVETNAQNARITRHLALIGTGMRQEEFHRHVTERLLDQHTCRKPKCRMCVGRSRRRLADVFRLLAQGTDQAAVQLFSKWAPSARLQKRLAESQVDIIHHPLSAVPSADLEANRSYHIWDGTPLQAEEFRTAVWAPAWKKESLANSV